MVGPVVAGFDRSRDLAGRATDLFFGLDDAIRLGLEQPVRHTICPGQFSRHLPLAGLLQRQCRSLGLPFTGCNNAQKTAVFQHLDDARHAGNGGYVCCDQPSAIGWRSNNLAKNHAFRTQLLHKHGLSKNLGGQVQPMHRATDKAMLADRLGLDLSSRFSLQRLANKQVPITDRGAGNGLHQAIPHAQAR